MNRKDLRCSWLPIFGAALVVVDQIVKILVKTNMEIGDSFSVIGNFFRITFIENDGMAFGMAFGGVVGKYLLTVLRMILFTLLTWWITKLNREKETPKGTLVGLTMIDAGALGNIIDCLFYGLIFTPHYPLLQGKVVDMFSFSIFPPIFNFADSCVSVGAVYLILFQWKFFASQQK